jgi:hypothetical protein
MYRNPDHSIGTICSALKVSKSTLYRYLRAQGIETSHGKGHAPEMESLIPVTNQRLSG